MSRTVITTVGSSGDLHPKIAIAYDVYCQEESYYHIFDGMMKVLRECRDRINNVMRARSHFCH